MRELRLDDAFWREAIGAIREGGARALAERRPAMAELLAEIAPKEGGEPVLIGVRLASPGRNGRLLAFLAAAFLARGGARTLLLDLSADLRWLERVVGEGLEEGLVDHLRYGVPLERCLRPTALPGLSVLTGGAYFLAGSPLEDAPGLRAAIADLRRGHDAVVAVLPHPIETADAAGLVARCDAVLTIQEGDGPIPLAGSERATIRLVGDPQAASELVRLADAYVGPLPALLAAGSPKPAARPEEPPIRPPDSTVRSPEPGARPAEPAVGSPTSPVRPPQTAGTPRSRESGPPREMPDAPPPIGRPDLPSRRALEEIDFLRAFEDDRPERSAARRELRPLPPPPGGEAAAPGSSRRPGPRVWIGAAAAVVAALLVVGVATGRFGPLLAGGDGPDPFDLPEEGPGTLVPLEGERPDPAVPEEDEGDGADPAPAVATDPADPGVGAPWSVHVGSYPTLEAGGRLVERIEQGGRMAFVAPVDLPGKGRWNRVFVGAYADSSDARRTLEALLASGVVEEGVVRRTPWAYRMDGPLERAEAERRRDRLAGEGIPAYVLGDGPAWVWAGAYRDADEAALLGRMIEGTADAVLEQRRDRVGVVDPAARN